MTNVGHATISVLPDMSRFSSGLSRGIRTAVGVGGIGAAFGIGKFINDSVKLEATYGRTMAEMKVVTQSTAKEMAGLDSLAIKLGKQTVFSANEASSAMLELAKNGIKPATIEAGALRSALVLAAAGGTDLTFAAKTMGNAINAFQLAGEDAKSVAAALAGAANASSASVESLALGLQQAATGANAAGLSVQETTGILAAFANAGIGGSDAGTSLKTMLTRLIPATKKVSDAMKKYGVVFTKSNGEFKSAAGIAKELKDEFGGLSAVERAGALNTIFGSDARRAATILTNEGAEGIRKYIKATSDQGAAQDLAKAKMKGTAGAMERLSGAWETVRLQFGKAIAPTVQRFLDSTAAKLDDLSPKLTRFGRWFNREGAPALERFGDELRPIAEDLLPAAGSALGTVRDFAKDALPFIEGMVKSFNDMPEWAKKALVGGVVGGTLFVKFGGGSLIKGLGGGIKGLFARGSSPANPLYVLDVGKGLGTGTLGTGSKVFSALGKGGLLAAFGLEAAIGTKFMADSIKSGLDAAIKQGSLQGGRPGGGKSSGVDTFQPWAGIGASDEQKKKVREFNAELHKTQLLFFSNKQAVEEFGQSIRTRIPRTIQMTVTGWDVAIAQERTYIANLLQIRSLHNETRLDAAGGSGPTQPSGKSGSKPSGRGVFDGATFHVHGQNHREVMTQIQRRAVRASMDGLR